MFLEDMVAGKRPLCKGETVDTFLDTIKDGLPFYKNAFRIESRYVKATYIFKEVPVSAGENLSEDIREMIVNITKTPFNLEKKKLKVQKCYKQLGYKHKRPSRKFKFSGQSVELDSKHYNVKHYLIY